MLEGRTLRVEGPHRVDDDTPSDVTELVSEPRWRGPPPMSAGAEPKTRPGRALACGFAQMVLLLVLSVGETWVVVAVGAGARGCEKDRLLAVLARVVPLQPEPEPE